MLTFQPIENPRGLYLKLVYIYCKWMFKTVITPVKVIYSRVPALLKLSTTIQSIEKKISLTEETVLLLRAFGAWKNDCAFCLDLSLAMAIKKKLGNQILSDFQNYETSDKISEKNKLILSFANSVLENKSLNEEEEISLKQNFSEKEIIEMVWVMASEKYYNTLNHALGIESDHLQWNI